MRKFKKPEQAPAEAEAIRDSLRPERRLHVLFYVETRPETDDETTAGIPDDESDPTKASLDIRRRRETAEFLVGADALERTASQASSTGGHGVYDPIAAENRAWVPEDQAT
ncbi:MAG TPA: hypothetical protein VLF88_02550 [Candidatus Babeliales bacterium]|nr:hypothetical protein [Candidatus Babeliales bacterium]